MLFIHVTNGSSWSKLCHVIQQLLHSIMHIINVMVAAFFNAKVIDNHGKLH